MINLGLKAAIKDSAPKPIREQFRAVHRYITLHFDSPLSADSYAEEAKKAERAFVKAGGEPPEEVAVLRRNSDVPPFVRRRGKGLADVHGELKKRVQAGWKLELVHKNAAPARTTFYVVHESTDEVVPWLDAKWKDDGEAVRVTSFTFRPALPVSAKMAVEALLS